MVISPDGKYVYVANAGSNNISVIDTATNVVVGSQIPVGSQPVAIAVIPENKPPVANAGTYPLFEAISALGASVTLNGSGSHDPSGKTLTYNWSWPPTAIASGVSPTATFPLGSTNVKLIVNNGIVDSSPITAIVTVQDTTLPILSLPSSITQNATNGTGASVTFLASALDTVDGSIPVTCSPASGSLFSIGVTTVNCSATDLHQNTATGSFIITVKAVDVPVGPPTNKDQCKKDGWKTFNNPTFKNQGQCVSFVEKHIHD